MDLQGHQARSVLGHLAAGFLEHLVHFAEDEVATLFGLAEGNLHDLLVDAFDLDVHLQGGDAFFGTGHLEVHVTQVVFVTQDIGQHGKTVAFLDQAHGDSGDRRLDRNAGVHQ